MEISNRILSVADKESKTIDNLLLKLMEEVGEVSQAYLSFKQVSGSEYKKSTTVDFKEELIDSLLVIITLLKKSEISNEELMTLLNKKINKWEKNQNNYSVDETK